MSYSIAAGSNATLSPVAMKRLQTDLAELAVRPIIGTSAEPVGDNIAVWKAVVTGADGTPYEAIPIHFALEFPNDYPNNPPHAYFLSPIKYKNGASVIDSKGRMTVCLDLFGNFRFVHTEWGKGTASGWTTSYGVSTILLQMQAMIAEDEYFATDNATVTAVRNYTPASEYQIEPVWSMPVATTTTTQPTIICYVTKESFSSDSKESFGIGIAVSHRGDLSSPCEVLSKTAYDAGTRSGTTNQMFEFWLPLYLDESHWNRVKADFFAVINTLYSKMDRTAAPDHVKVITVLSSLMNSSVVKVMELGDSAVASDNFIDGYFAMYRLLRKVGEEKAALHIYADAQVQKFKANTDNRSKKSHVPNLGEWLILLLISPTYKWENVASEFLEECETRNVFWYVQGNHTSPPKYPELANLTLRDQRNEKVFAATEVSRRIVCFQTRFLTDAASVSLAELDANLGMTSPEIKKALKNVYHDVTSMKSWAEYFIWNKLAVPTDDVRCTQLIEAIKLSNKKGYTKGSGTPVRSSAPPTRNYGRKY